MPYCNVTLAEAKIDEQPLWKGFTFHHFGLFLSFSFGLVALIIACFLIFQHATHYSKPSEQKHIIRILFMIPVYSIVSFLSYKNYQHAIYYEVLRDCYEAFAISSFFALLCAYIDPVLHEQKEYFRALEPRNWILPINWFQKCTGGRDKGWLRRPRSGLTWFNVIWISIFQYCFIRVLFTIVSVITQATDRYCESSLNPAFAHIWVMVFESISVTIAMYCLIQFYIQLKGDLAQHRPGLKVLCIKLVIFFSFWQTIIISFLSSANVIKVSPTLSYPDIKVGMPSVLLCIEMAFFAVLHLFAFSWRPYDNQHSPEPGRQYRGGLFGYRAYIDAWNPVDIIKASARGFRWLFVGSRKRLQDPSYHAKKKFSSSGEEEPGYAGVTFAGNGDVATEMLPQNSHSVGVGGVGGGGATVGGNSTSSTSTSTSNKKKHDSSDDRHGLLSNVQTNPQTSPLHTPSRQDNPYEMPSALAGQQESGVFRLDGRVEPQELDTGYHGASSLHQQQQQQQQSRPPQQGPPAASGAGAAQWDLWAGAARPPQSGGGGAGPRR